MTAHAVRQVAYFVPDAARAARDHSSLFGSGPYFLAEHVPLRKARAAAVFTMSL